MGINVDVSHILVACVLAVQIAAAAPAEPAPAKAPAPAAKPEKTAATPAEPAATHKVARELLKLELSLKGSLEPVASHEIAVQPDSWATLEVGKAADHGQTVKKGDLLLQLDTEKIDEAIADLQLKRALTEPAIQQSEASLKALRATTPLDLKAAERALVIAQEDLARYLKIDRGLAEKSAALQLKSAEQALENQRDELRQLEKMYKADDLTEETEEIVLKRQRRAVEAAEFMLETSRAAYQDTMKSDIPRKQETLEVAAGRQEAGAAKAKVSVPATLAQTERELEKAKTERIREDEKLKKLQADREKLVVRSPIDGVVYYGRFARGKWSAAEGAVETLKPGAPVVKGAVVMTVVQLRPLAVRASVGEAEVRAGGLAGHVPTDRVSGRPRGGRRRSRRRDSHQRRKLRGPVARHGRRAGRHRARHGLHRPLASVRRPQRPGRPLQGCVYRRTRRSENVRLSSERRQARETRRRRGTSHRREGRDRPRARRGRRDPAGTTEAAGQRRVRREVDAGKETRAEASAQAGSQARGPQTARAETARGEKAAPREARRQIGERYVVELLHSRRQAAPR
jgi:HlyD family secretion protein